MVLPKHSVREKFNKIHFFADIDIFLSELKLNRIRGEKLSQIEAAAKRYAKNVKQTPSDKNVENGIWRTTVFWQCRLIRSGFLCQEKGDI